MRWFAGYGHMVAVCVALLATPALAQFNCAADRLQSTASEGPVEADLQGLARWVAERTGEAELSVPRLCILSTGELSRLRGGPLEALGPLQTVALYSRQPPLILLDSAYDPGNPVSQSVIVHELVHHAQAVSGRRFACSAEAERDAYDIQEEWLSRFGLSLESAFGINRMALFVLTNCGI
jgi:Domain of unknown function (DUF6647)